MQITIIALGSRGDVQPFVPLGQALQANGHRVRVATFEAFAPMIQKAGLGFHRLRGDAQALVGQVGQGMLVGRNNPILTLKALRHSYGMLANSLAEDLSDPVLHNTELLLNQLPGNLFGYDLAEFLGVPVAMVAVIPLSRTRSMPAMGFPAGLARLPGYNALSYRLAEQGAWQMFRTTVNRWRIKTLSLPPSPFLGPYKAMLHKRSPVINGFSEHVVPRPADWGEHIKTTGWWYPEEPKWSPPADLERFLATGPPPVFIGFGSMPVEDPAGMTDLVVEAVRMSGQRALLHAGWAGLGGRLPAEILPITYAPYGWLFLRMAMMVHHGGSGTSGFGFRSGVPSLVVPFGFDQFYWGKRVAALGVGPQPIPYPKLTAEGLATAILEGVSDKEMSRKAAALGRKVSAEKGVEQAVAIIERLKV
jgi:UDP:flavonoid glycosyltransferase YjiC (YdhE family)